MSTIEQVLSSVCNFASYKTALLVGGPHDGRITYCGETCKQLYMNAPQDSYHSRADWAKHHFEYREVEVTLFYSVFELYDSVHS